MKRLLTLLLSILALTTVRAEYVTTDTLDRSAQTDTLKPLHGNWVQQMIQTGFHINDPRIKYPRFPRFCLGVYNWGNRLFNTFDPEYVVGTGKNWKASVNSFTWSQSYSYVIEAFSDKNILLQGQTNSDLGFSVNFMAVGISYNWDVNHWATGKKNPRSTFNFTFNCSRFIIELTKQHTEGNVRIRRFGTYSDGARINVPLDNCSSDMLSVSGYYYFNNFKYSHAAPYVFTRFQLRSAGTWLAGFKVSRKKFFFDFTDLPVEMKEGAMSLFENDFISRFDFREYDLSGGYAYNWVFHPKWVLNATALVGCGLRHSKIIDRQDSMRESVNLNLYARSALTYNHRAMFCSVSARFDGGLVFNSRYSFFNTSQSVTANIGFRF